MKSPLITALLVAAMFGIWPVFVRMSKASPTYINMMVSLFTLIIVWMYFSLKGNSFGEIQRTIGTSDTLQIYLPILAGVLNAVGIILYGQLLSSSSIGVDVTKYVPIATGALPVFTVIAGSFFLLGEEITWQKIIGVVSIAFGVYILGRK